MLSELNADHVDYAFLCAARFFFLAFSNGDHEAWVSTILGSENLFPGPDSAEQMRLALAVVQEMRIARGSCFRFSNPRCANCTSVVTKDERYLLQMVQHARAGQRSKAVSSAMLLCEGNATERVVAAAFGFAALFPQRVSERVGL